MKKSAVVFVSMLALLVGACSQLPFPIATATVVSGPTGDSAATSDALFKTAVAQTLTALPAGAVTETATLVASPAVPTETATPVASPVLAATDTAPATQTLTVVPEQVTGIPTGTADIPTATGGPINITATLAPGLVTASPTLGIRTYGTLPPAVPFSQVTLINKANTEAYISLQVTMPDGKYSIIEYPVEGRVKIQAPVGSYLYVAWVGGRKMVGEFRLKHNDDLSITLYRDRVEIK